MAVTFKPYDMNYGKYLSSIHDVIIQYPDFISDDIKPFSELGFSFQDQDPFHYGENSCRQDMYSVEVILFIQSVIKLLDGKVVHEKGITTITGSPIAVFLYSRLTGQQAVYSAKLWEYIFSKKYHDISSTVNSLNVIFSTESYKDKIKNLMIVLDAMVVELQQNNLK